MINNPLISKWIYYTLEIALTSENDPDTRTEDVHRTLMQQMD